MPMLLPPASSDAFVIAVLPDTQIYPDHYPDLFLAQARFLRQHARRLGVAAVVHVGDVTNRNHPDEWEVARAAFAEIDAASLPLVVVTGNHDLGPKGGANNRTTGLDDIRQVQASHASLGFLGTFDASVANSAYVINTTLGEVLVIGLEFAPRPAAVAWAKQLLTDTPHALAVVATHAFTYHDDTLYDRTRHDQEWCPSAYGVGKAGGLDGEQLFAELRSAGNVQIIVSGHVLGRGVARVSRTNHLGRPCHALLANYQHRERGGDGYLRLLEFDPVAQHVRVYSYSPAIDAMRCADPEERIDLPL